MIDGLTLGGDGAVGKTPIEVTPELIIALSRLLGDEDDVERAFKNAEYSLVRSIALVVAKYADEIERAENKPIANRKRHFSENEIKRDDTP